MKIWILANNFCQTKYKIHEYWFLSYNVIILCNGNFGILHDWCLQNKIFNEWMYYDFNLLYYELFEVPKTPIIFKVLFKHKKWLFSWTIF